MGLLLAFLSTSAFAFVLSSDQNLAQVDFQKPTRVLVVGYSHGLDDLFLKSALGRALRYRSLSSSEQILVLREQESANDRGSWETRAASRVLDVNNKELTGARLVNFLLQFRDGSLKSMDIYSHGSTKTGVGLSGPGSEQRLNLDTPGIASLKTKFSTNAFVTLNGCNLGFIFAPAFSKLWSVPVLGSLTGTDIQQLHENGSWYFNNPGQYPAGSWMRINNVSFSPGVSASRGAGFRMKPQNSLYVGQWGSFEAGLPHYKFFCYRDVQDCESRMVLALMSMPSVKALSLASSKEDFKKVARDFLCAISSTTSLRQQCENALIASETSPTMSYSPFRGNEPQCNAEACDVAVRCSESECHIRKKNGEAIPQNRNPRDILDEYKRYNLGISRLRGE